MLTALDRADLIAVSERPAGEQDELIAFLRATFASKTQAQWIDWFADKDVAFSPVLDLAEALAQPHVVVRGLLVEHDGAHPIGPAIRFAGEDWSPVGAPALGSDG